MWRLRPDAVAEGKGDRLSSGKHELNNGLIRLLVSLNLYSALDSKQTFCGLLWQEATKSTLVNEGQLMQ